MMNSSTNNPNDQTHVVDRKFLRLKKDLKLLVFSYLPIEENFYSLLTCNRSFKALVKNMKIFPLITTDLIKCSIEKQKLTDEFKEEMITNSGKYFDSLEERDQFVSWILRRVNLNRNYFTYHKLECPKQLEKAYMLFLIQSKNIHEFSLRGFNFTISEDIEVLNNLKIKFQQSPLKNFGLSWNQIGAEGVKAVVETLKINTFLQIIDLSSNKISLEELKEILEPLRINSPLKEIFIISQSLGAIGAKLIADMLSTNTSLENIEIGVNQIGNEGLKEIAAALRTKTSLQKIYLSNNIIGDDGVKAIAETLKINTSLHFINLRCNHIRHEGAKAIAETLKINTSLRIIDLCRNQIGDEGAKVIADAIIVNPSLKELNLRSNQIGNEGAKALSYALRFNVSLIIDLEDNEIRSVIKKAIKQKYDQRISI